MLRFEFQTSILIKPVHYFLYLIKDIILSTVNFSIIFVYRYTIMEFLQYIIDLFLHLDKHLNGIINQYGTLTYAILFLVIFAETGFVFTPFLPGDSLLFAAGTFAALGSLNVHYLFFLL